MSIENMTFGGQELQKELLYLQNVAKEAGLSLLPDFVGGRGYWLARGSKRRFLKTLAEARGWIDQVVRDGSYACLQGI